MAVRVPIRVACLVSLCLAACGAVCQDGLVTAGLSSLPDAPSAAAQTETVGAFADEGGSPIAAPVNLNVTRESGPGYGSRLAPSFSVRYNAQPAQKTSSDFFDKFLYATLLRRNSNYHPSSSDSLVGRTMYAASRIFVTHDESGQAKVNTSYFVGVLGSAALHMAYRPYWARSASAPFSDFGSTVGNDAGMNLLHEFRPGLEQLMKNHAPRFMTKIEERMGRN
ncbi:MAG: hypothetical protein JWQ87_4950 [Candidatus Sulfotelmatobacter sp.]|nr:hypothetical protein [Candidatus Sulfotelmatobacter sp.]